MEGYGEGMRHHVMAAKVAPPYSDGGVVGGGVEDAVVAGDEGVDGFGVGFYCFDAFEVGDSPYFHCFVYGRCVDYVFCCVHCH